MELSRDKNVATIIAFPLKLSTGAMNSGAAGLDSEIETWANGSTPDGFTDCTNEATEIGSTGVYYLSLSQSEMNNDFIFIRVYSSTTNAITQHILINTKARPVGAVTLEADQAVNATKIGGTTQTGRDLGASVLISPGTGTGQLDVTSGVIKANLAQILGTALTETAGYLAAGFKKVFNVASPVFTAASVNQTGDCYARVGAPAGASLAADIAAIQAKTVNLPASPAAVGSKMDIADSPSATGLGVIVSAFWDKLLTSITITGSIGKLIKDYLDAAVSSRLASASYTAPPTGSAIADAICDEVISTGHSTANSLAKIIYDNVNAPIATVDTVVDAIKAKTDNLPASPAAVGSKMDIADSPSSTGVAVIVSAIWNKLTSGISTSDSIGKLIKDYLDAAVTTRAAASTALSTSVWTSGRAALLDFLDALISSRLATAGYSAPPSAAGIADQVWDEQMSGHTATGSAGKALSNATAPSVSEIDAELSGNHGAGAWGASAVGTIAYPDPEEPFLENGEPMVGVKVEAFSNSARSALVDAQITDVNGNFQFHLNAGTYWFRASHAGHSNYEWSVVLE